MKISKKIKWLLVACLCAGLLGFVAAQFTLIVNLGTIKVNETPAHLVISTALMNGVTATVSGDGQSASFSGLPDMTVGDTTTLTVTIENTGGTAGNVSSISVNGAGSVLTFTPQFGSLPITVGANSSVNFIWDVEAVSAGTVTPSVSFS